MPEKRSLPVDVGPFKEILPTHRRKKKRKYNTQRSVYDGIKIRVNPKEHFLTRAGKHAVNGLIGTLVVGTAVLGIYMFPTTSCICTHFFDNFIHSHIRIPYSSNE